MLPVFITDGLLRKSLSTTRSLGKRGIPTIAGEKSWLSPSGYSKYCRKRVKYPSPETKPHLFMKWLVQFLQKENHPIFLPMDDAVMELVMEHRDEITTISKCLLPTKSSYAVAADKYETMRLATKQKIDCPATYLAKNLEDLREIAEMASFPLIIKPRKSSGSRGIRQVPNKEALVPIFLEIRQEYAEVLIQEFIPLGDRYDVCLLYDGNHEIRASFVQREVRHFPIAMGPSTVQESVIYDDLIERSKKLLKPLGWSGIVEVEYMMDSRTNVPILLEINPRFWNSLDLSIQSGIDFPYLLYQLAQGEEVSVPTHYEIGRRSRWLFPGDVLHFLWNPKRLKMKPSILSGKKQRLYDDTFSINDPIPGVIWIFSCLLFTLNVKALKTFFTR
ncbi:carboxylate--amine ligase [Psychrobacillus lasiicapitis]|uniref:ATP-grasp domain-containing protein n=1 Tax=Psychrobacillus lasiicapitis TaxID=1636719 RepID=A0A544T320_9BACI|nr:ATP-grasp domain-containing protein [Psychrobacillus lasiicapitis]TQR11852.1 ATP-grasp domain-containing protein [Psychrobacillus lasiicapitis]